MDFRVEARAVAEVGFDELGPVSDGEDEFMEAESLEPVEDDLEDRLFPHWEEGLGDRERERPEPRSQPARQNDRAHSLNPIKG